jgi:hypothetical protein
MNYRNKALIEEKIQNVQIIKRYQLVQRKMKRLRGKIKFKWTSGSIKNSIMIKVTIRIILIKALIQVNKLKTVVIVLPINFIIYYLMILLKN